MKVRIRIVCLIGVLVGGISSVAVHSQTVEKAIVAPAGESYEKESFSLDWTMGEMTISSYNSTSVSLMEGFHAKIENSELSTLTKELENITVFSVYPNPARELLYLTNTLSHEVIEDLYVCNIKGNILLTIQGRTIDNVRIGELPPGTYYLLMVSPEKTGRIAKFLKM